MFIDTSRPERFSAKSEKIFRVAQNPFGFIAEYTGTCSSKIALALSEAGLKISLVTPAQSKAVAQIKHLTTQNDRSDARILAQYGTINASELRFYQPAPETQVQLCQLLDSIE